MRFKLSGTLIKTVFVLVVLVMGYVGYLKCSEFIRTSKIDKLHVITRLRLNLVQSRTAWMGLSRLNAQDPNLITQKSNLIQMLENSLKTGKELTGKTNNKYLIAGHRMIYQRQENILAQLLEKSSFSEGINYLRSDQVVQMLADITNMILDYQYTEDLIKEQLSWSWWQEWQKVQPGVK
jgi:hypothetical protein